MNITSAITAIRNQFIQRKTEPRVSRPWSDDEIEALLAELDLAQLHLVQAHARIINVEAQVGARLSEDGKAFITGAGQTLTLQQAAQTRRAAFDACISELRTLCDGQREAFDAIMMRHFLQ